MARKIGHGRRMTATLGSGLLCALLASPGWSQSITPVETPLFLGAVAAGKLPPVAQRLPLQPSIVDLSGVDQAVGVPGGELRMLMGSTKDVRQMVVYGYTRLVGYDRNLNIGPDVAQRVDVEDGRIFTFHLREGHKWSNGHPFTAEDFRYYWEEMATNREMNPGGPPMELLLDGEAPKFEVVNATTVRYSWSKPNPFFLPMQAQPAPIYLYRPAHFLKKYHARHQDPEKLKELVAKAKRRNWVELHFREDHQFRNDNPDMPSLEPWVLVTEPPADRFIFMRNPYFHRMDVAGHQLPYVDRVVMSITNTRLISAKAGAGEADLQARGIQFSNYTFLKKGEKRNDFSVRRWDSARGAHMALYPNLNTSDEGWRDLFRKVEFRRALSLAIDRHEVNQVLLFGLAVEGNNTVLAGSPLHRPDYTNRWAGFDIAEANKLLDGLGLTRRDNQGLRLLPDGRPMEIVVETAGEDNEQVDVLGLIHDNWLKIGIKLFPKALQREVFRKRVFTGTTLMSVWYGLENGLPTADSSPGELVPTSEYQLQWPAWGRYYDSRGRAGEAPDLEAPKKLLALFDQWRDSRDPAEKTQIWHQILAIHADQVLTIGLISRVPQPVVVNNRLRNVPVKGIFNWDPGAHFGIYRPDTFWYAPRERS